MKPPIILIAAFAAVCLISCKAHKAVVTESVENLQRTDTTKTTIDTLTHRQQTTDTTKTAATFEGGGMVEFVEGGGKVTIDSAGNVTLSGVKGIRGHRKADIAQVNGKADNVEQTAGHRDQANGIMEETAKQIKQTDTKPEQTKWYNTMFARIGQGVCIAALLWLLFLYIKRKK